ncbi:NADH-FMN oxidoreductase RutF, flavin reductase (DIM6/NTAB) family [Micromonospora phaseoli]|uniref:NADH-FMN oxidoreductase RutF, flavin reductase (DIM6/NTAB) family n=1 Tax=Micromonospora phaseoli TaxID=1144548 RepID=A0A1H7BVF1_9ACTN|nr:flavin reductase (DIM6/NTAB) family NADH-FMN oxidoreductase RutF [Micromonospora phaseoli]SEJ81643.1 NADH-FMN oxidoreductase RutF, flavin reductase (DIM6/NTAB) family [Micromonospora phaseoli]
MTGAPGARTDPPPDGHLATGRELRRVFGTFATGVAVLTVGGEHPHGMTANSFASVSLDPPLVLVCVGRSTVMHACLAEASGFGVSVLAAGHAGIARYFADSRRPVGPEEFSGIRTVPGARTGVPLIAGALAWFECEPWRRYDGGDHTIVVGRLLSAARVAAGAALLFHDGLLGTTEYEWRARG